MLLGWAAPPGPPMGEQLPELLVELLQLLVDDLPVRDFYDLFPRRANENTLGQTFVQVFFQLLMGSCDKPAPAVHPAFAFALWRPPSLRGHS